MLKIAIVFSYRCHRKNLMGNMDICVVDHHRKSLSGGRWRGAMSAATQSVSLSALSVSAHHHQTPDRPPADSTHHPPPPAAPSRRRSPAAGVCTARVPACSRGYPAPARVIERQCQQGTGGFIVARPQSACKGHFEINFRILPDVPSPGRPCSSDTGCSCCAAAAFWGCQLHPSAMLDSRTLLCSLRECGVAVGCVSW